MGPLGRGSVLSPSAGADLVVDAGVDLLLLRASLAGSASFFALQLNAVAGVDVASGRSFADASLQYSWLSGSVYVDILWIGCNWYFECSKGPPHGWESRISVYSWGGVTPAEPSVLAQICG